MKIKNILDSCCPPSEELEPYYLLHRFAFFFISIIHTSLDKCMERFLLHYYTVEKTPNFGSFIFIQCWIRYMKTVLVSIFRSPYILQLFKRARLVCHFRRQNQECLLHMVHQESLYAALPFLILVFSIFLYERWQKRLIRQTGVSWIHQVNIRTITCYVAVMLGTNIKLSMFF